MSSTCSVDNNLGFLYPNAHQLVLAKAPGVQFFCSGVSIPSMSMGKATQPTLHTTVATPGDKMDFDPFSADFYVDANLNNWNQIFMWMKLIGMPENKLPQGLTLNDLVTDISVIIKGSAPTKFTFIDAFPTFLRGLDFDVKITDLEPMTSTVSFEYTTCILDGGAQIPDICKV